MSQVLTPRPYQIAAAQSVPAYFARAKGNPLIAMPTGTGKSLVIAMLLQLIMQYAGQRVMVLTHVKELIAQNYSKLLDMWPTAPAGIYSAGLDRKELGFPITFAGIGSVYKKPELWGHVDLIIIDEAHLVSPHTETMYRAFIDALRQKNPSIKVIGLSATCYRLGLGPLTEGGLFTDICFDITDDAGFTMLLANGWMVPLIPRRTALQVDTSKVRTSGGEFVEKELQAAFDQRRITRAALEEVLATGADRHRWMFFGAGTDHCEHISELLDSFGVTNVCVHSKIPDGERDMRIERFRHGRVRAAVNNNILTTGFDCPEVDLIAVLTATQSTNKWVQLLGRGTRPAPWVRKQNCLVLDFGGNTARLGPINDPVLPRRPGKKKEGVVAAPVRICDMCATYNHTSAKVCISCGTPFASIVNIMAQSAMQELMKLPEPVVQSFDIDNITYRIHEKKGRPDSLQVSYFCQFQMFREWVCLEHPGSARTAAVDWWRKRSDVSAPMTTKEAYDRARSLAWPKRIKVWTNREYPEIVDHEF